MSTSPLSLVARLPSPVSHRLSTHPLLLFVLRIESLFCKICRRWSTLHPYKCIDEPDRDIRINRKCRVFSPHSAPHTLPTHTSAAHASCALHGLQRCLARTPIRRYFHVSPISKRRITKFANFSDFAFHEITENKSGNGGHHHFIPLISLSSPSLPPSLPPLTSCVLVIEMVCRVLYDMVMWCVHVYSS